MFGVYDGDIEQFINRYMAVNSSCFAKSAVHYKEQGHHFLKCIIITNYGISMEFNQCFFLSRWQSGICLRALTKNARDVVKPQESNLGKRRSSPHYFFLRLYSFNSQVSPAKEYLFINDEGYAFLKIKYVSFKEILATVNIYFVTLKIFFRLRKFWNLSNPKSKPKLELDSWHPFRSLLLIFVF